MGRAVGGREVEGGRMGRRWREWMMRRVGVIAAVVCAAAGVWGAEVRPQVPKSVRPTERPARRAVSLTVLQSRLKQSAAKGEWPAELVNLCGLTRVTGYVVDERRGDLVLLGEVEAGAPALDVGDLAVALRNAGLRYAPRKGKTAVYSAPGCSIDPDPEVVRRLSAAGQSAAARGAMEEELARWCEICAEPQKVRVMGVPFESRFAQVMVGADYLMKRLADGSVGLGIAGLVSLAEMRAAAAREEFAGGGEVGAGLYLNRFWFCPGRTSFREEEGVVGIEECAVALLTEEEYLTGEGIAGRGRPEPRAQEFAEGFSAHYQEIAAKEPIYRELEGLFRFVALAKLIRYQKLEGKVSYLTERLPMPKAAVPRTLPGIARVVHEEGEREIEGGKEIMQLWMPSCGGVSMDVRVTPQNFKRSPAKKAAGGAKTAAASGKAAGAKPAPGKAAPTKKEAILKARPAADALYWDL